MKNHLTRIDAVWMAISVDPDDETEGVCAFLLNGAWTPLIAADEARLPFVRQKAAQIAEETGMLVKLIRLSTREEVESFDGRNGGIAQTH